jgi:hypothetical protein
MTFEEMAWEFVEVFDELEVEQINEMLAKNVPLQTLEFFASYGRSFGENVGVAGNALESLPNLMLIGYLLRVLEDRLINNEEPSE